MTKTRFEIHGYQRHSTLSPANKLAAHSQKDPDEDQRIAANATCLSDFRVPFTSANAWFCAIAATTTCWSHLGDDCGAICGALDAGDRSCWVHSNQDLFGGGGGHGVYYVLRVQGVGVCSGWRHPRTFCSVCQHCHAITPRARRGVRYGCSRQAAAVLRAQVDVCFGPP